MIHKKSCPWVELPSCDRIPFKNTVLTSFFITCMFIILDFVLCIRFALIMQHIDSAKPQLTPDFLLSFYIYLILIFYMIGNSLLLDVWMWNFKMAFWPFLPLFYVFTSQDTWNSRGFRGLHIYAIFFIIFTQIRVIIYVGNDIKLAT